MKEKHLYDPPAGIIFMIILFSFRMHAAVGGITENKIGLDSSSEILFEEQWSSGNFTSNNWTFEPSAGNWHINLYQGNPMPSAQFSWSVPQTNYSFSLVSREIETTVSGTTFYLSFDLLYDEWLSTGYEKMKVHVSDGSVWHQIAEFSNNGDIPWTTYQYDITPLASGNTIRLKFEATGQTTVNIDFWRLDNIRVTAIQSPPQPVISISPDSLFHYLPNPGSPASWQLTLTNSGQANLELNLDVEYVNLIRFAPDMINWIQLPDTTTWSIPPESSIAITINILTNGILPGFHLAGLVIQSNDPQHPVVIVPASIEVGTVHVIQSRKPEVRIYPQPAKEILNIESDHPIVTLSIFDQSGKLVQKQSFSSGKEKYSITGNYEGIYTVELMTDSAERLVRKVVFSK